MLKKNIITLLEKLKHISNHKKEINDIINQIYVGWNLLEEKLLSLANIILNEKDNKSKIIILETLLKYYEVLDKDD